MNNNVILSISEESTADSTSSWMSTCPAELGGDPVRSPLLIGEGKGEIYNKTPMDSSS